MTIIKREIKPAGQYSGVEIYRRSEAQGMLQDVAFSNMTGVLHQLGLLSRYATEMFKEVYELASGVGNELNELSQRAEAVATEAVSVRENLRMADDPGVFYRPASLKLPEKAPLLQQGLFTEETRDPMLAASYRDCYGPPNVASLDEYCDGGKGSCLKKYSNPAFFFERWLQHEQERQLEEKNRRVKRRKKKKKKRGKGGQQAKVHVKAVQKVARSGLGAEFDADPSAQTPTSRAHGRRGSSVAYERVDARDFSAPNAQRPRRRSSHGPMEAISPSSSDIAFTQPIDEPAAPQLQAPPQREQKPPAAAAPGPAPALPPREAAAAPDIPRRGPPPAAPPARRAAPAVPPPRGASARGPPPPASRSREPPAVPPSRRNPRGAPGPPAPRGGEPSRPTAADAAPAAPPSRTAPPPHVPLSRIAAVNSAQQSGGHSPAQDAYAPPEVEVRRPSAFEIDEPARPVSVERVDPSADPRFAKYVRMQKMGLPQGAIRQAMERDGIDPEELFGGDFGAEAPAAASPAASPPRAAAQASAAPRPAPNRSLLASIQQGKTLKKAPAAAPASSKPAPAANPLLAAIRGGATLKKTTPVERPKPADPRSNMLAMLRGGGAKLKKVERPAEKPAAAKAPSGGGVAAILARRIAIMGNNDDSDSDSDDDSDWED